MEQVIKTIKQEIISNKTNKKEKEFLLRMLAYFEEKCEDLQITLINER